MFTGRYEHTIDAKGRVSLPSKFREILASQYSDDRLIITSFTDPCLLAYPATEWQALVKKVSTLPRFDPRVVQLKRIFISGATECLIDRNGRVLIPPMLRGFAHLEREVIWAGVTDTIEIWSKADWDQEVLKAQAKAADLGGTLGSLGL
jgi:MraZ protein